MKRLIKTINGESCEIYAISHHNRLLVGKAVPNIEIYEQSTQVKTIGANSARYKRVYLSVAVCPNPEMDANMTEEFIKGITSFDLAMQLPRKDNVVVPFDIYGAASADISPDCWEFEITDPVMVRKLLVL
ncbi:MAG: hypothetical protein K6F76_01715 [Clostridiales bacterium]|nr:hypothetical protein [Clostridiales bacterium]